MGINPVISVIFIILGAALLYLVTVMYSILSTAPLLAPLAGIARNPKTGAQVKRLASRSARFRAGEGLKSALN